MTHNRLLQEYNNALKTIEELKRREVLIEKKLLSEMGHFGGQPEWYWEW